MQQESLTKTPQSPEFNIGICMAGAVSAGAYTAGVMDYLTEALENYEKFRQKNIQTKSNTNEPTHKVAIPVMGGASAGGMTGIIATAVLQQSCTHLNVPDYNLDNEHKENGLYHSWVDLADKDMFPILMDNSDINDSNPKEVRSLLNSDFLLKIAHDMVNPEPASKWQPLPQYVSPRLKVFVTLSNLEGFLYDVNFNAPQSGGHHPYYMQIHNDFACFQLCDDQNPNVDKGWLPLNLPKAVNNEEAGAAAMATGAFPVGLQARFVVRTKDIVNNNPFLKKYLKRNPVTQEKYKSLNIDGA